MSAVLTSLVRSGWALLWPLFCVTPCLVTVFSACLDYLLLICGTTLGGSLPPSAITPFPVWADVTGRGLTLCPLVIRDGTASYSPSTSSSLSLSLANTWYLLLSSSGWGGNLLPPSANGFFMIFQEALLQPVEDSTAEGSLFPKGGWSSLSSGVLLGGIPNISWMSCLVPF